MNWNDLLQSNTIEDSNVSSKSDTRSEFEKDYQKIVGSVSFRRLQDKTQVFPLDKSDFIRTRLTHSIEVSSFARTLGEMVSNKILEEKIDKKFKSYMKEDISHILECAGLIHDIGNPPFGHFGEVAIKTWFNDGLKQIKYKGKTLDKILTKEMISDFVNFDGNAQGLRLVTKLNFGSLRPEQSLTYALLGTIIKYPNSYATANEKSKDIAKKKQGYFYSEKDVFEKTEKVCGLNGKRHPLTYLLEAADDIAYATADIEDGFKKGFIKFDELINEIREVEKSDNEYKDSKVFNSVELLLKYRDIAIQNNIKNPEEYAISKWIIDLQNCLLNEVSKCFIKNYDLIMNGKYKSDLFTLSYAGKIVSLLKDIGWRYIFDTSFIYGPEVRSWHVYEFLLKKFVRAVLYYDTNLSKSKISPIDKKIFTMIDSEYVRNYHNESYRKNENEKLYFRLKLVVDFISSMTDTKAITMYQELTGII